MFDRTKKFYSRKEASVYLLEEHGVRQAVSSLAKLKSGNGGPVFLKDRRQVIYPRENLDAWVAARVKAAGQ